MTPKPSELKTADIFTKLRTVKTMPELDVLRADTVSAMEAAGEDGFYRVQKAFIAAKNRLLRIPLKDRTW